MKTILAVLAAMTFASGSSWSAESKEPFKFTEANGPYRVGLHVVDQTDSSRVFAARVDGVTGQKNNEPRDRPLLTLIWYPASATGTPLTYADYLELAGREDQFDRSPQRVREVAEQRLKELLPPDMPADEIAAIKRQPMTAARDAPELRQKFPLIIYAPSFNASAFENADLCEFLASHGYVVMATASMSAHSRWMTQDIDGAEAQARDIRFLIGRGQTLSDVDAAKIVVIGYSWGGVSNFFAAALDDRITALVAFDGGIRNVGKIVADAKYVTPEHLTIPVLYLSSRPLAPAKIEELKLDVSDDVLSRLIYSDVYTVTFNSLVHYEFASEHLRFLWRNDPEMFPGDYSFDQTGRTFGWIARYTLDFIDGITKDDEKALKRVSRPPSGDDSLVRSVSVRVTLAKSRLIDQSVFAAALRAKGFEHATEIYEELRKQSPAFEVTPPAFNEWISELLAQHDVQQARAIAELFRAKHADRPGPYYWLAMIAKQDGNKKLARENLRMLLKIRPDDAEAKKELAALGPE